MLMRVVIVCNNASDFFDIEPLFLVINHDLLMVKKLLMMEIIVRC